jgi:putative DNA primase/helicase
MTMWLSYEDTRACIRRVRDYQGYSAGCCPAHEDENPSMLFGPKRDGGAWFKCLAGCPAETIRAALVGEPIRRVFGLPVGSPAEHSDCGKRVKWAHRIWSECRPATGTMVASYLRSRGIGINPPASIRYHAALRHPTGKYFPAIVARVEDVCGRFGGIQRIYLKPDGSGKADVEPNKVSLGACGGGAVRLAVATKVLALAEGIETALSILQATDIPTWACLGTSGLKALQVPGDVHAIFIGADADRPGLRAAHEAAYRFLGENPERKIRVAVPPRGGTDWNDILRANV